MMDTEKLMNTPAALGLLGSLLAAMRFMPGTTWYEKIVNIVAGLSIAVVLTPALVTWLHMTTPAYTSGAAFLLGLTGVSLTAALLNAIKEFPLSQIVTDWLSGIKR